MDQQAALNNSQVAERDTDGEMDSDSVSVADSASQNTDLYSLEEVNDFLEDSFGRPVDISSYFPDAEKFIQTVTTLQKVVGTDLLDEKKRYCLKKHVTVLNRKLRGKKPAKKMRLNK